MPGTVYPVARTICNGATGVNLNSSLGWAMYETNLTLVTVTI